MARFHPYAQYPDLNYLEILPFPAVVPPFATFIRCKLLFIEQPPYFPYTFSFSTPRDSHLDPWDGYEFATGQKGPAMYYYRVRIKNIVTEEDEIYLGEGVTPFDLMNPDDSQWFGQLIMIVSATDLRIIGPLVSDRAVHNTVLAPAAPPASCIIGADGCPAWANKEVAFCDAAYWDLSDWPGATASQKADTFENAAKTALFAGYTPDFWPLGLRHYWPLGGGRGHHDSDVVSGYDGVQTGAGDLQWIDDHFPLTYPSRPLMYPVREYHFPGPATPAGPPTVVDTGAHRRRSFMLLKS